MRLRGVIIGVLAFALVAGAGLYFATQHLGFDPAKRTPFQRACEVRAGEDTVDLDAHQMANAATIAAVGIRRGIPYRGIVIALATAFQESKLENLAGGDRDSVGLFQQRPSQGWGTAKEISDPRYAATRFYNALLRVKGWETMRVTDAAQKVQRSAYPEAYEKWADESEVLAGALAGRVHQAVSCTPEGEPAVRGASAAEALTAGLRLDWGNVRTQTHNGTHGLIVTATTAKAGWQYAHWLVAHSTEKAVKRVRFGTLEWTADEGRWTTIEPTGPAAGERVVAEVYT